MSDAVAREKRSLAIFVSGATISNAGSFMQATAVPFVLYELTGSNAWVGAAAAAALGFSVLIGPVAGIAIDRFSQKRVLMLGQVVQLVPALLLAFLAAADALKPWPMLALVAIGGIGAGLQFPAAQSFVPTLVSPTRVANGIRYTTLGLTVSRTVGPALAGLLLTVTNAQTLFALNASTFVIYFGLLFLLHPRPTHAKGTTGSWIKQYRGALRYVRARPSLVAILTIGFLGSVFGASMGFLMPGIADLYGAGAGGVGALTAVYGLGAIVGSTVIIRAGNRLLRDRATRLGYVGYGVGALIAVSTAFLSVGIVAFIVVGIGYSLWLTSIGTALQVQLTDEYRGRITTFYVTAVVGGTPIGAVFGGWLGDIVGLRPVLVAYGLVLLVLAAIGPRLLRFDLLDIESSEAVPRPREAAPRAIPPVRPDDRA
ncbi:MAG: MFS transporter, partial [Acidimicrobiia bacterium]